jgi:acetyl-CoA synthetase
VFAGYLDRDDATRAVLDDAGWFYTGDLATRAADGQLRIVGRRSTDIIKSGGFKVGAGEVEEALLEHPAVAEAAVVPSPDAVRLAVPKAFVVLAAGHPPSRELARDILRFCRKRVAPYKRIKRIEFADLPKTISGKIRRVELRVNEAKRRTEGTRAALEFFEEEL